MGKKFNNSDEHGKNDSSIFNSLFVPLEKVGISSAQL